MSEMPESQQAVEMPTGIAWGDPISSERLAELRELFARQQVWAEQSNREITESGIHLPGDRELKR